MTDEAHITALLQKAHAGDEASMNRAVEVMYSDLRRLAAYHIGKQYGSGANALTLQPTALVNETYIKLLRQQVGYANRKHFVAIATRVMLRVLVDYQRTRSAQKRGGDQVRVTLAGIGDHQPDPAAAAADLEGALGKLESLDGRKADVVRLRVIWGMDLAEIADTLEVSIATVERDWRFSKHWLAEELDV